MKKKSGEELISRADYLIGILWAFLIDKLQNAIT